MRGNAHILWEEMHSKIVINSKFEGKFWCNCFLNHKCIRPNVFAHRTTEATFGPTLLHGVFWQSHYMGFKANWAWIPNTTTFLENKENKNITNRLLHLLCIFVHIWVWLSLYLAKVGLTTSSGSCNTSVLFDALLLGGKNAGVIDFDWKESMTREKWMLGLISWQCSHFGRLPSRD